jgi:hypothetical protein
MIISCHLSIEGFLSSEMEASNPLERRRDPSFAKLDIEYNELIRTWREFQDFVPPGDQVNFLEGYQKVENVVWIVQRAKDSWMSDRRPSVPRDLVPLSDRLVATLSSHAVAMSALPDELTYSSLFYAVLQSVIQVSIDSEPHLFSTVSRGRGQ